MFLPNMFWKGFYILMPVTVITFDEPLAVVSFILFVSTCSLSIEYCGSALSLLWAGSLGMLLSIIPRVRHVKVASSAPISDRDGLA